MRKLLGHASTVTSVALLPHPTNLIITTSLDRTAKVWDATSGELARTFQLHDGAVSCVAVSLGVNPPKVATGDENGGVLVWDPRSGTKLHGFSMDVCSANEPMVSSVAMSANGAAVTASAGSVFCVWYLEDGFWRTVDYTSGVHRGLSNDGSKCIVHSGSFVDVVAIPRSGNDDAVVCTVDHDCGSFVGGTLFAPLDDSLVATFSNLGDVRVSSGVTGAMFCELWHGTFVMTLAMSPDKRLLVVGAESGDAFVWRSTSFAEEILVALLGSPRTAASSSRAAAWRRLITVADGDHAILSRVAGFLASSEWDPAPRVDFGGPDDVDVDFGSGDESPLMSGSDFIAQPQHDDFDGFTTTHHKVAVR